MQIGKIFEQFTRAPARGRKVFGKLSGWKTACAVFLLCGATAIASSAQTFTTLASFDGVDGANPQYVSLVQGRDGSFYGTTLLGANVGTVFKITPAGTLTRLYTFCAQPNCSDGAAPVAGLVQATDGNFYGTTSSGANESGGTVFKITPGGTLTTLYNFCAQPNCVDGRNPFGTLVQASDGNFYGTTAGGGADSSGTVFRLTPKGILTTLYSFANGAYPVSGVVQATDGMFYGTTYGCGSPCGSIFRITPGGKLTTLHSFDVDDGTEPSGSLIQATDGNLYGTTSEGGDYNSGTVFKITLAGTLTTLYKFCAQSSCTDGAYPFAGLVQATDGNFYGTTYGGGNSICTNGDFSGCGTVFKMTPEGALTTLHSFDSTDGANPWGGLVQATNGILYGTTHLGGANNYGTVFSLDMGLGPFVSFVRNSGKVGANVQILGQGFTGATAVSFNGTPATFRVLSDTFLGAIVPAGATTGYVTVTTPSGALTSNVPFRVRP